MNASDVLARIASVSPQGLSEQGCSVLSHLLLQFIQACSHRLLLSHLASMTLALATSSEVDLHLTGAKTVEDVQEQLAAMKGGNP